MRKIHFFPMMIFGLFLVAFFASGPSALALEDRLKNKYETGEFKILIVPGHDNNSSGAEFRGVREADLNLLVGKELFKLLGADPHFRVYITRDDKGYTKEFSEYFSDGYAEIVSFRDASKKVVGDLLNKGVIRKNVTILHNYASDNDSVKLYGINKWAGENGVDLVLHLHFNDYPRRYSWQAGEYSGFSIYVPEKQLPNHSESMSMARSLLGEMEKYFPISDLPLESTGIIEDQELIAVGPASWSGAAVLVEFGYIYEPQFVSSRVRAFAAKELAYRTYLGIKKYFDPLSEAQDISLLPYEWKRGLSRGSKNDRDVFALQLVLAKEGLYPPKGTTKNECGITGNFGECTLRGIISFQEKFGLPATGFVGPLTLAKLNELYFYPAPRSLQNFSHIWARDLRYGLLNNEDVRALQNALLLEGVYQGPLSGNFLDDTKRAVIEFQKKQNIRPAVGYVGPATRKVLSEKYSSSSTVP